METRISRWSYIINDGDMYPTHTRDSWTIPEAGAEIWCTGWARGQTIKPYGDGCHVVVDGRAYHCDELMGILERWERDGHTWGIDGVSMTREQKRGGYWTRVPIQDTAAALR